jgi:hypothetical protein
MTLSKIEERELSQLSNRGNAIIGSTHELQAERCDLYRGAIFVVIEGVMLVASVHRAG